MTQLEEYIQSYIGIVDNEDVETIALLFTQTIANTYHTKELC